MVQPDPWRGQLAYHEIARIRRDNELFDWERVLMKYLLIVLAEEEPLRFSLKVGQPVYNVFNTEMQVVSEPFDVYLDAARRWIFQPTELLAVAHVGAESLETFLLRLDFATEPDFDTSIYNRLRLEHLLQSIRDSNSLHFRRLLCLYQVQRYCQTVLPGHGVRIPPLEDAYRFLEEYRFSEFRDAML